MGRSRFFTPVTNVTTQTKVVYQVRVAGTRQPEIYEDRKSAEMAASWLAFRNGLNDNFVDVISQVQETAMQS